MVQFHCEFVIVCRGQYGTPASGFYWTRTRDAWILKNFNTEVIGAVIDTPIVPGTHLEATKQVEELLRQRRKLLHQSKTKAEELLAGRCIKLQMMHRQQLHRPLRLIYQNANGNADNVHLNHYNNARAVDCVAPPLGGGVRPLQSGRSESRARSLRWLPVSGLLRGTALY